MKTIAFLGDSITYGYGLEDPTVAYPYLVARRLGLEIENYGITGTLVAKAGLNTEDGKDFVSRISLVDDADIAVVFGGTNDYFWSDTPISGGENDAYFEHALGTLCRHIQEVRKGKLTLFVTPYPHNGIGNYEGGEHWKTASSRHDTDEKNFTGSTLADYAAVIEKVCNEYGIPCLNLHENFNFDWQRDTLDGCHPNKAGHVRLADAIEIAICAML